MATLVQMWKHRRFKEWEIFKIGRIHNDKSCFRQSCQRWKTGTPTNASSIYNMYKT